MPTNNPLDRSSFDYLAGVAGLDLDDAHMDELFSYVQASLAVTDRLHEIDTAGYEPDAAFDPAQFYQE